LIGIVPIDRENPMLDIVLLALACGLFAVSIGYAALCERL
jgi:TctA family transporter